MIQRILTLSRYLLRSLLFSLTGLIFLLGALAYYIVLFSPGQRTPDVDYFILVLGAFGGGFTFLVTLSNAARANRAESYTLMARLPSRVEYLTAVVGSSLLFATLVQIVLALLVWQFGGTELTAGRVLEIPPLWLALNLLIAVVALHASDFVAVGWSRSILFGVLLALLFLQSYGANISNWLGDRFAGMANWLLVRGTFNLVDFFQRGANWFHSSGADAVSQLVNVLFWPFRAVLDATIAGFFQDAQALAPAILLLYATFLFFLASDLLAGKDLYLVE